MDANAAAPVAAPYTNGGMDMTTYRIPVFFEVECDNAEAAREILAGLLSEGFIDSDPNLIIDAIAIANVDEIETLEHANV